MTMMMRISHSLILKQEVIVSCQRQRKLITYLIERAFTSRSTSRSRSTTTRLRRLQEVQRASLSSHAHAELELSTDNAMLYDKVEISVHGLSKGQRVTLHTQVTETGATFGACGHYVADDHGHISTFLQPSLGGSFTGLEPMGLFWNMASEPENKVKRLLKTDITNPFEVTVSMQNGFIDPKNLPWTGDFSEVTHKKLLKRHYMAPGVKRILVEEDGIFGSLFLPPGPGPHPALIDIYGLMGGLQEFRPSLLASKGFATLALAYVDYKSLPKDAIDLDFGYFLRAFDWLSSHPAVNPKAMGCVSICAGGGYGMFIASRRPQVRCLVNINGLCLPSGLAQVVEGEEVPAVYLDASKNVEEEGAISFIKLFMPEEPLHVCPAWQHGAKILFLTGEQDRCVSPRLKDRIKAVVPAQFEKNTNYFFYPGAGHLLEPPYGPLCRFSYMKMFDSTLLWGGQPKLHADAQEDVWKRLVGFLQENLSSK